jgi:dTDP-glucose pyrophosphorylase
MSFIFLCGGQGKRFNEITPCRKPTMLIFGRPMYFWVLDSIKINKLHVVIQNDSIGHSILLNIQKQFNNVSSTKLDYFTRGPAETCMLCVQDMTDNDPFWVLDNDVIYDHDINWDLDPDSIGILVQEMYLEDKSPYSHVQISNDLVVNIKEKVNISNYIVLGAYGFGSPELYKKVFDFFMSSDLINMEWYMSSIIKCAIELGIKVKPIFSKNTVSIGTPLQLQDAISNKILIPKPLRWVFDLDETLVTLPVKLGDYTSVLPIPKTIDFLRYLYDNNHHIIIHTARHMKTCNNNIELVKSCIQEITKKTLSEFNIPYHELVFGKPYADVYVDDKATNPLHWQEDWTIGSIGFGWDIYEKHKKIIKINNELFYKIALKDEGFGNMYFIKNCSYELITHIPKLYDIRTISKTHVKLLMEWKDDTITISQLYIHDLLDTDIFIKILNLLKHIHNQKSDINSDIDDIMMNYYPKFHSRYKTYNNIYKDFNINMIKTFFDSYKPSIISCIHGDYWFGNLLWSHKEHKLYMIDMRGRLGDKLSINGDKYYDYAKLLQSIYGFDILVQTGKYVPPTNRDKLLELFNIYFDVDLDIIKKITAFLILGSIPFHEKLYTNLDEVKKLIKILWPNIINENCSST